MFHNMSIVMSIPSLQVSTTYICTSFSLSLLPHSLPRNAFVFSVLKIFWWVWFSLCFRFLTEFKMEEVRNSSVLLFYFMYVMWLNNLWTGFDVLFKRLLWRPGEIPCIGEGVCAVLDCDMMMIPPLKVAIKQSLKFFVF